MKKYGIKIVGLIFLCVVALSGCGNKEEKLESILTNGTGRWVFVTKEGEGKIIFFEDGTAKIDDDGEVNATYQVSKDGSEMKLAVVDSDVYTTMMNIKFDGDQIIKGDISKNGNSETESFKLVK